MAESSIGWTTDGVGDGINSGYSQAQFTEWQRMLMVGLTGVDLSGVAPDYLNELAVTGTVSPVSINTGGALVYGFPYFNSSAVTKVIATPSTSTRIDRIVLEANWTAQTVRIAVVAGTEGGAAPALVQTASTIWQMSLATASITTGGVITVTDQREWLSMVGDGAITTAKLADGAALAEILDDDGAGSLLDADLLDGVQGSGYATAAHNHMLDAEGDPAAVTTAAADGTSAYAARRDHVHTLADNVVTMAKLADIATDSLIGRDTAGTGDPMAITLGASLSFTGSNSIQRAALTGDVTSAANSNALAIATDIIEYTDMRPQYAFPLVVYSPGANFDFTTQVTADFDTLALDYDGPNLFTNDGAGAFTVAAACNVEIVVSGYVGHATGTTEAWANIFIEVGTSGSSYSTLAKTGRIFYVPALNWGGFHTMGVTARAINEKVRVRIERSVGSDTLRLSSDSAIILRAFS